MIGTPKNTSPFPVQIPATRSNLRVDWLQTGGATLPFAGGRLLARTTIDHMWVTRRHLSVGAQPLGPRGRHRARLLVRGVHSCGHKAAVSTRVLRIVVIPAVVFGMLSACVWQSSTGEPSSSAEIRPDQDPNLVNPRRAPPANPSRHSRSGQRSIINGFLRVGSKMTCSPTARTLRPLAFTIPGPRQPSDHISKRCGMVTSLQRSHRGGGQIRRASNFACQRSSRQRRISTLHFASRFITKRKGSVTPPYPSSSMTSNTYSKIMETRRTTFISAAVLCYSCTTPTTRIAQC